MATVLICATTTGYQLDSFRQAAARLGHTVVLATDRCHVMDNPWGDQAIAWRDGEVPAVDGVVALGEKAALFASALGLRFHLPDAVRAAADKRLTRERFRAAGLPVPKFQAAELGPPSLPCVLKPLHRSGSQGVIRADTLPEFAAALQRIRRLVGDEPVLAESFIPGREFALEGLVRDGILHPLVAFAKPDPLDGPFFEETIYLTQPAEPSMVSATEQAIRALGLTDGPIHAEMRVNQSGVWMLEVAPRPIGGLCARVLPGLEEAIIRHALGEPVELRLAEPRGVLMIPIPREGILLGFGGVEEARRVPGVESVEITAKLGQHLRPLPEGASYLGFIFAEGSGCEAALREAHARLRFDWGTVLPVAP